YDSMWGTLKIRVIVLSQLPMEEHNAVLLLFSPAGDRIEYAKQKYSLRSLHGSTRLKDLFENYWKGLGMSYTFDEFARNFALQHLPDLSPEERLKGLPAEDRLKDLSPEDQIKALSPEALELVRRASQRDTPPKST